MLDEIITLFCEICGSNIHHSALTLSFHANGDEKKYVKEVKDVPKTYKAYGSESSTLRPVSPTLRPVGVGE